MKRLDPVTLVLLTLAAVVTAVQFVWSFFVHVAERGHMTNRGWVVPPTRTYIQAFTVSEVTLTVVVLAVVVLVALLLQQRIRDEEPGAGRLAWGVSIATLFFGMVGWPPWRVSIGVFLCIACASVRRRLPDKGARSSTSVVAESLR